MEDCKGNMISYECLTISYTIMIIVFLRHTWFESQSYDIVEVFFSYGGP